MRVWEHLAAIVASFALVACSTSGASQLPKLPPAGSAIFVSEHYSGYEARHIGAVVRTLEKHGFVATQDRSSSNYYLDFSIGGGVIVTVKITLLDGSQPVVEVSSKNLGWGTMIARPVAISSLVSAALKRFDSLLTERR